MTTLPKGSLVYGGLPGPSAYYTTEQTLLDGNFDSATVFDSLQLAAHPVFGYRPEMGVYQVLEDTQVPTGQALANPDIGSGGAQQFFFGNYGTQLQLVNRIPLGK
jgi:filamentous hemagglutinin